MVSIVSYSRPSLMIIASRTQFHVERPWGKRLFSIVSSSCLRCESASRRFQPGEGPSSDCTTGCGTDGALHSIREKLWVVPPSSSREFPRQLGSGDDLSEEDVERRGSVNMTIKIICVKTILGASILIIKCPCLTTISHDEI